MKRLKDEIVYFLENQGFVIVSTIGRYGRIDNSCKGIVKIKRNGLIYLLDLYKAKTYDNLKRNSRISITAVDEHRFRGYCLKGRAKILTEDKLKAEIVKAWEDKITSRITQRVLRNIRGEKGHAKHPEVLLPKPQYLIVMDVKEIVDLTPHHIKEGA